MTQVPPELGGRSGENMPLRMRVHDREPIGAALRRFKKLLERSGLTKELRKRKYYEKPCRPFFACSARCVPGTGVGLSRNVSWSDERRSCPRPELMKTLE